MTPQVTPEDAERGIYLDFEGFRTGTPSMAGTLIDDDYVGTWLHPTFAPVAEHLDAPFASLEDLIATLVRKAEREDRQVFAYSIHEAEVVVRHVPHYAEELAARFANAHTIVRRWANRTGLRLPRSERSLKTYYEAFFEPYPNRFARSSVPAKLRRIAGECRKKAPWQEPHPKAREALDDLLEYNRLDCTATRLLVTRAAKEA